LEICPTFVTLSDTTFTVYTEDSANARFYYYRVIGAADSYSDNVQYSLEVIDRCVTAATTTDPVPNQTLALGDASASWSLVSSLSLATCSPTFTYSALCYADNTYTGTLTCPTFITLTTDTFTG